MQTEFNDGFVGIRRYRSEDIPFVFDAVRESITEISAWMPWCHKDYSMDDSKAWVLSREAAWEKGEEYSFIIFEMHSGVLLGGLGLNHIDKADRCANLGYWVRSARTRQGIASAACLLVSRFGFQELGFNRLEIIAATGNKASQRVAEKIGAQREALLRKRLWLHGTAQDAVMYSLVSGDFNT